MWLSGYVAKWSPEPETSHQLAKGSQLCPLCIIVEYPFRQGTLGARMLVLLGECHKNEVTHVVTLLEDSLDVRCIPPLHWRSNKILVS